MDAITNTLNKIYANNTQTLTHLSNTKSYSELSDQEKAEVRRLKALDAHVHQHEEAHKQAAGELTVGTPNYQYTTGPDGKRYAVAGDVKIETSKDSRGPAETITKAIKIRMAALAPSDPSSQDRNVAAQAMKMEQQAQLELAKQKRSNSEFLNGTVFYNKSAQKIGLPNNNLIFNLTL